MFLYTGPLFSVLYHLFHFYSPFNLSSIFLSRRSDLSAIHLRLAASLAVAGAWQSPDRWIMVDFWDFRPNIASSRFGQPIRSHRAAASAPLGPFTYFMIRISLKDCLQYFITSSLWFNRQLIIDVLNRRQKTISISYKNAIRSVRILYFEWKERILLLFFSERIFSVMPIFLGLRDIIHQNTAFQLRWIMAMDWSKVAGHFFYLVRFVPYELECTGYGSKGSAISSFHLSYFERNSWNPVAGFGLIFSSVELFTVPLHKSRLKKMDHQNQFVKNPETTSIQLRWWSGAADGLADSCFLGLLSSSLKT